jgi:hypothetical protein
MLSAGVTRLTNEILEPASDDAKAIRKSAKKLSGPATDDLLMLQAVYDSELSAASRTAKIRKLLSRSRGGSVAFWNIMLFAGWLAPLGAGGVGLLASVQLATDVGVIDGAEGMALFLVTVMWAFSAWWLLLAIRIVAKERRAMHFHLGWWGFGFPTAAFATLTAVVARRWELPGLAALDPVLWVAVLVLIAALTVLTVRGLRSGATWVR